MFRRDVKGEVWNEGIIVCVQGLSSAIVVSSLKKQAKKENIGMDILP